MIRKALVVIPEFGGALHEAALSSRGHSRPDKRMADDASTTRSNE
jgi:hypothetical protein